MLQSLPLRRVIEYTELNGVTKDWDHHQHLTSSSSSSSSSLTSTSLPRFKGLTPKMDEMSLRKYVKLSETQYLLLNPDYLETDMFVPKLEQPDSFFDLHTLCRQGVNIVNKKVDDSTLGSVFALIGHFNFEAETGHVFVMKESNVIDFKTTCSLQLVILTSKITSNKIMRRVKGNEVYNPPIHLTECLSLYIYKKTTLIIKENVGRQSVTNILSLWNENFIGNRVVGVGIDPQKIMKRKHVSILNSSTALRLIEEASLETAFVTQSNTIKPALKKTRSLEQEATTISYSNDISSKESLKSKLNLREEAVSLVEGAFEQKWSPENFVQGYLNLKKECDSTAQLAATAATILMDPSFRITDCTPIMKEDVIDKVSIDIDQVRKYNTIQYNTIQYNTIQYNRIQSVQYNTIQFNTIQYNTII